MMSGSLPTRKPSGGRPLPSAPGKMPSPQLNVSDYQAPASGNGISGEPTAESSWEASAHVVPKLARAGRVTRPSGSTKPKLSLSPFPSPLASPALPAASSVPAAQPYPTPVPPIQSQPYPKCSPALASLTPGLSSQGRPRPPLLSAPSAGSYGSSGSSGLSGRGGPGLKLSITGLGGSSSNFASDHDYPAEDAELRTPTAGEDPNPTVMARGREWQEDGEGYYGRPATDNGSKMSAMTDQIRQALSSYGSPNPSSDNLLMSSSGSRPGSSATLSSMRGGGGHPGDASRRGSVATIDSAERLSLDALKISGSPGGLNRTDSVDREGRRDSAGSEEGGVFNIFDPNDLITLKRLGEGAGGSVELVKDQKSGRIMAKKVIARTADPALHKQLLRELRFLSDCSCPYIVDHYGSFLAERDSQIGILMEYCEGGSLDGLMAKMRGREGMRCSEHVLGRIASSVLRGLDYLYGRRIIHRDIKPSNILLTRQGVVKLIDFGVSGELDMNSIAGTFTGTSFYMAPERITGKPYTITADVWSLGLTLYEIAHLRFPFPEDGNHASVTPIELVSLILTSPTPQMVDDEWITWSPQIKDFMDKTLIKSGEDRPLPSKLLQHPFITANDAKKVNMAKWVALISGWQ